MDLEHQSNNKKKAPPPQKKKSFQGGYKNLGERFKFLCQYKCQEEKDKKTNKQKQGSGEIVVTQVFNPSENRQSNESHRCSVLCNLIRKIMKYLQIGKMINYYVTFQ